MTDNEIMESMLNWILYRYKPCPCCDGNDIFKYCECSINFDKLISIEQELLEEFQDRLKISKGMKREK